MAKGDGSIYELGRGKWRVSVDFGTNPITGKRERVTRVVNGSKAEARRVRDKLRQQHEGGLSVDASKVTFAEFATSWHESRVAAGEIGQTHIRSDAQQIKTINVYIGTLTLSEITPQVVESMYAALKKDKVKQYGKYSGRSMHMIHQKLKQILSKAIDYDLILRNPCDRVSAPRREDPERKSLSVDEAAKLLRCLDASETAAYCALLEKEQRQEERGKNSGRSFLRGMSSISNILAVRIGLATGARRGEVLALCWGSLDLAQRRLDIVQSITTLGEVKVPKTRAGMRSISLDKTTCEHLKRWKRLQGDELSKIGIRQLDTTPVCCSDKGDFIDLNNFGRWWRTFRKGSGFDGLKFHELRHTQATQLLANGVDVKTVQSRLGHANAALTLNWYAHAVPENDEKAADLVENLFSGKQQDKPRFSVKTA